jgi:hypothetical protein
MTERLSVEARDDRVVFELGDRSATLTPREAQRFAYELAGAYMRANGIVRNRAGNIVLKPEERAQ